MHHKQDHECVKANEMLTVTKEVDENWYEGTNIQGITGIFPKVYVQDIEVNMMLFEIVCNTWGSVHTQAWNPLPRVCSARTRITSTTASRWWSSKGKDREKGFVKPYRICSNAPIRGQCSSVSDAAAGWGFRSAVLQKAVKMYLNESTDIFLINLRCPKVNRKFRRIKIM